MAVSVVRSAFVFQRQLYATVSRTGDRRHVRMMVQPKGVSDWLHKCGLCNAWERSSSRRKRFCLVKRTAARMDRSRTGSGAICFVAPRATSPAIVPEV